MKVRKRDIMTIKAGVSMCFQLDSYKDCITAQKYAYLLSKTDPRPDVAKYSTSIDSATNRITITAIAK